MNEATSARGGCWLEAQSSEYDVIKYHVVTATEALGVVEKLSVWKISNPEVQYRFERRSSGLLRLQCWYDSDFCVGVNNLENVCAHGFQVDAAEAQQAGLILPVGIIPPAGDSQLQRECCFILLDVAVGRSFVFDGNLQGSHIPTGYDSLYIPDQQLDRNKDGKFSLQEYNNVANFDFRSSSGYSHKYFVSDMNQVCPKYIVRFQLQKPRQGRIPDLEVEDALFVDPITLLPADKAGGASGAFDKRLVSIDAAFAQALEDISRIQSDPTAVTKAQWIKKQLSTVEDKVRDINLNYAEVSEAIQDAAAHAQRRLQDMVRQKLELCLSLEIELRRQTEQVEWLDGVLTTELHRVQSTLLEAPTPSIKRKLMLRFLKLWKQHALHRNTLSRAKPYEIQALSSLHPDLRVQPDIKIFVDPFFAANSMSAAESPTNKVVHEQSLPEEHEVFVNEFAMRACEHNYFSTPLQSSHPYLASSVRAIIDQEMGTIQQMLAGAGKQPALQLPPSISGIAAGGGAQHQPLLSLHAVLDLIKSLPSPSGNASHNADPVHGAFVNAVAAGNTLPPGVPELSLPKSPPQTPVGSVREPISPPSPGSVNSEPLTIASTIRSQSHHQLPPHTDETASVYAPSIVSPTTHETAASSEVSMTIAELKQVILPFRNFFLSDLCAKKMRQLQIRTNAGVEEQGHRSLDGSRILAHNTEEIQNLYYCLPFFSRPPILRLIYSTTTHPRCLEELYARTMKSRTPVVLLIRSGNHRFGAYLSHSPLPTCSWSGTPACFLFSLTLNLKIPYHGRQAAEEHKRQDPMALFAQDDRIFVGNGDFTIDADISTGTSEVENCYGLGLEAQSVEAMCLLAGAPVFRIDDLEIWSINP